MNRTVLAVLVLSAMVVVPASAETKKDEAKPRRKEGKVVDQREKNQRERIQEGRESGELNRRESRKLAAEQARIRAEERRYRKDGDLTAAEKADLHRDQDAASQHIHDQKHDEQQRPGAEASPEPPPAPRP